MNIIFFLLFNLFIIPLHAASNFDLAFNIGPSLSQSGGIEKVGDPDLSTGLEFNYFIKPMHGIGFAYNNEFSFEGSKDLPLINDASISTFDIHYSYRYIKEKFQLLIEPGFGWQTLYDSNQDYYWGYLYYDDLSTAFIFNYKIFARYVLKEWDYGEMTTRGSFFLGLGVIQIFSMDDDYNGKDISGNRLAGLFQVGVGW